jgi:hypothetical protein
MISAFDLQAEMPLNLAGAGPELYCWRSRRVTVEGAASWPLCINLMYIGTSESEVFAEVEFRERRNSTGSESWFALFNA